MSRVHSLVWKNSEGDGMTPTNKFRWLCRNIPTSISDETGRYGTEMVLQQWWACGCYYRNYPNGELVYEVKEGEWRDVPIEEEK